MAYFDFPIEKLREYQPVRNEPDDFDDFWQRTLSESGDYSLDPVITPVDYGIKTLNVFDVTYSGYQGQRIKGWLLLPEGTKEKIPCVVEFIGYNGGRSIPYDWLTWGSCGYAHFVMDTRGQGSDKRHGDTPDMELIAGNAQVPGFMTRGILSPETYYYRRVFVDAVRAVETTRTYKYVDASRIAVTGRSQGGGITLAVAGLVPDISVTMPDVPFLCHFKRAIEITDAKPYGEIAQFCKTQRHHVEQVFKTLSYFDGVNFASRNHARSLFSVGLMDKTCPPSTVFAAYNHYAGEKDIQVWPYNDHEGGEAFQIRNQVQFLKGIWG